MDLLYYNDIDFKKVEKQYYKVIDFLKKGDFASAEIKKMPNTGYYRAKLDYENRLLFKFAKYNGKTYLLILDVILNHQYDKSRFLRGAEIDTDKIQPLSGMDKVATEDITELAYINPKETHFHYLDKVISFDDDQKEIFNVPAPLIIIGSAGSGKTVLTLEKIKHLKGNVLYVTISPYLVENSSNLYYSNNYYNEQAEVNFLSFREFLESIKFVPGKEIQFRDFEKWFHWNKQGTKIKAAYKLYEEFKGVLTGFAVDKEYLSAEEYMNLGIKQSVFLQHEREQVYALFEKYLKFLAENNYYDTNIISYKWLSYCKREYDFIVIDEVQDITNVQLYLILKTLKNPTNFIICGDSNQVVHPNFFSWSHIKTLFYKENFKAQDLHILHTNYRNSPEITQLANTLLKIKNARFGSIDKESTYLIDPVSAIKGDVMFYEDIPGIKDELNRKTKTSTKFAVLVMTSEEKAEARKYFQTPLIFSVQEAKGLEYENIILVNFISNNEREFFEISNGVEEKIIGEDIHYSRARDKTDKSLDTYKFFINSLYVAITRAIRNFYIIESSKNHALLRLLGLVDAGQKISIASQTSSMDDWKKEARRLEMQGKNEQAEEIRKNILSFQVPEWEPLTIEVLEKLKKEALDPEHFNKKAKDRIFDYALIFNETGIAEQLAELKYRRAEKFEEEKNSIFRRYYQAYKTDDVRAVVQNINKYGVNYRDLFNLTPLQAAVTAGAVNIIKTLLENGADRDCIDNYGRHPLQMALFNSYFSQQYSKNILGRIYNLIRPDFIKIKAEDRIIKIDNNKIEYFLLNLLIALQPTFINRFFREWAGKTFRMDDILITIMHYPESVLPDFRKKRTYLNANIAKHEVSSENPYNKKLFVRIERGAYVLNPRLEVLIGEIWVNIYELMKSDPIIGDKEAIEKANTEFLNKMIKEWEEKHPEIYSAPSPKSQKKVSIKNDKRNESDSKADDQLKLDI
jgi:hypothetical protein